MIAAAFVTSLQEAVVPREMHHLLFVVTQAEPRHPMNVNPSIKGAKPNRRFSYS